MKNYNKIGKAQFFSRYRYAYYIKTGLFILEGFIYKNKFKIIIGMEESALNMRIIK